jgi:sulfur carrier protein
MQVIVNGHTRTLHDAATVLELLQEMDLIGKRVAVECNGSIVPRSAHGQHPLAEGDRLGIVVAVGGG